MALGQDTIWYAHTISFDCCCSSYHMISCILCKYVSLISHNNKTTTLILGRLALGWYNRDREPQWVFWTLAAESWGLVGWGFSLVPSHPMNAQMDWDEGSLKVKALNSSCLVKTSHVLCLVQWRVHFIIIFMWVAPNNVTFPWMPGLKISQCNEMIIGHFTCQYF